MPFRRACAPSSAPPPCCLQASDLQAQLAAAVRERERLQEQSAQLEAELHSARSAAHQDQEAIRSLSSELEKARELASRVSAQRQPRMQRAGGGKAAGRRPAEARPSNWVPTFYRGAVHEDE